MVKEKKYQIFIYNNGNAYQPIITGKPKITWSRNFKAGILEFSVVKDDVIDYQEGNSVSFNIDGEVVFKGYVFSKKRNGKQVIDTVCYDQVRYLKNKDTYQYKNLSYSDLLKKVCADRLLTIGEIEETGYKIEKALEQNQEYIKMLENGNNITVSQTGNLFTLFDDRGKITLKSPLSMVVDYPISYNNAVDFDYETSIDNGTFNRVVVYLVDDDGKQIDKIIKEDEDSMRKWGVLSYSITTNNKEDIDNKASQLLELFNRKYRSLTLKNVIGDIRVRAGCLVPVEMMAIGDIDINSYMLVEKVVHTFYDDYHFMDMEVRNKDIMPIGSGDNIIKDKKKEKKKSKNNSSELSQMLDGSSSDFVGSKDVIKNAQAYLGTKYDWGGISKGGIDCSGLVTVAYRQAGIDMPRMTSADLRNNPSKYGFVPIPVSQAQVGDVLWNKGHVALKAGENKTIEAIKTGVSSLPINQRNTKFTQAYRYVGR